MINGLANATSEDRESGGLPERGALGAHADHRLNRVVPPQERRGEGPSASSTSREGRGEVDDVRTLSRSPIRWGLNPAGRVAPLKASVRIPSARRDSQRLESYLKRR